MAAPDSQFRSCPSVRLAFLALAALVSMAAVALPLEATAVIVATGDGSGNTTAPADDFGFANVGAAGETAVYIGDGWVLTANHVGEGDVTLAGRVYPAVAGSKRRLRNATPGVSADLAVFRLQEPLPPLPPLSIRTAPPEVGDTVVLMGNGPNRGEPIEFYGRAGWRWSAGHTLRWGTSRVHEQRLEFQADVGDRTTAFSTRLSPTAGTEYEATVAIGDSGGGAFIKNGDDQWELAGILIAAQTWQQQPARSTLYGNLTYAADLSVYRDQILAITSVPACRNGLDDDDDGRIDHPEDEGCTTPDAPFEAPDRQVGNGGALPRTRAAPCGRGFGIAWLAAPIALLGLRRSA